MKEGETGEREESESNERGREKATPLHVCLQFLLVVLGLLQLRHDSTQEPLKRLQETGVPAGQLSPHLTHLSPVVITHSESLSISSLLCSYLATYPPQYCTQLVTSHSLSPLY